MTLLDTIAEISRRSVSPKNRVDILLEKWEGTPDGETLLAALHNEDITAAALTRALRQECHARDVVKDSSVAEWRRANASQEINGL